ncbi:TPR-like protein [Rhizophagus irregularis]|uniref:TPR-like protein n=1 Tax=Rhizophagus irregularis TaxID=588596 RepID=A0A2I1GFW0_9GLOM|nr:TPR-like protein [Rhizophagus irregularis]
MDRISSQNEGSSSKKRIENNYEESYTNIFENQILLKLEMDGFTTSDEKVKKLIEELAEVKYLYALKLLFEDFQEQISDHVLVKSLEELADPVLFKSYYSKESAARLELHIRTWIAALERVLFLEIRLTRETRNQLYNSLAKFAKIHRKTTQVMKEGLENNIRPKINKAVEERLENDFNPNHNSLKNNQEKFENLLQYVKEKCHKDLEIINRNNENKKGKETTLSTNKQGEILNKVAENITCPISSEPADKLCTFGCKHTISLDSFKKLEKEICPICRQNIESINILPQNTIYKSLNSQFTKAGHITPSINLDHTSDSNDSEVDIMLSKKMNFFRNIKFNTNKLQSIFRIGNSVKKHPIYQNVIKELIERNYKQAIDECQKYLKSFPKSNSMKCLIAYSYRCLNNYDQACLYLDEAIELKDKDPIAWYIYGEIFFRQNKYEDAIPKLEISRGLNANIGNLNIILGYSYLFLGMKSNNKSNYSINEHALKIFDEIQNGSNKSLYFKYCAYLYEMQGDYINTLRKLDSYLNINDKDSLVLCYYGEILIGLGRYNEAIELFKRAYDMDPENLHNLSKRAITYHMLGKYEEALSDLNKVLQLNQSYSLAYHYRGLTFYSMKNINKSISDFEKCVKLNSNDMLGRMQLLYLKKLDDINSEIDQIANIDDDKSLLFIRCKIYIESKEYDKALLDLDRLFDLNYDDISFIHLLREYFDFWIYVCDYYNISDDGFTDFGIVEKLNKYIYKVKAIYFVSNLDNLSTINYNIQDDDNLNSLPKKVLIMKNKLVTFPRLSNIWWDDVKYYVAWRLCIRELPSKDCSLNFMIKIGNGDNLYRQIDHILEYEKLSKFIGLGWTEYTVPSKVESDMLDWIELSVEANNDLVIKIDYVQFTKIEKDHIYLPKIDCLPIYKLHPSVPKAFEDKYFQKQVLENLLELNYIINYL